MGGSLPPDCIFIPSEYEIPPPPEDYVASSYLMDMVPANRGIVRLGRGHNLVHTVLFQGGGGTVYIDSIIVDNADSSPCFFNVETHQTWGGGNFIYVNDLVFIGNSSLSIGGDFSSIGHASISILIRDYGERTLENLRHISSGGNRVRAFRDSTHSGYYRIVKGYEPWTPVPEASTYGAAFSFSALGVLFVRRRKKKSAGLRKRLLTPS